MKKRAISILLVVLMAISLLPMPAMAYLDEGDIFITEFDFRPVLGEPFDTSAKARINLSGNTFELIADVTWVTDDLFPREKVKYTMYIDLTYPPDPYFFKDYNVKSVTINGEKFESSVFFWVTDSTFTFQITFLAMPDKQYADSIHVTGLETPILGKELDTTVDVAEDGAYMRKITWSPADTFAEANTEYTAVIDITNEKGYPNYFYHLKDLFVNGESIQTSLKHDYKIWSEGNSVEITYKFPATPALKYADSVHVTGLDSPVAGKPLDTSADVAEEGAYISKIEWSPADSLAKAGTVYTANIILGSKDGYPYYYDKVAKLYINGNEMPGGYSDGHGYMITEANNALNILYKFPAVIAGNAPVITVHPRSFNALEGEDVTFSVTATGESLHYEWWVVDAGMPHVVGGDSSVLTLKKVNISEHNMYDYWCIVSNEAGKATSQKAHLNVFESSYVFPFTDVPRTEWYRSDVEIAQRNGLINGKTPTLYAPNDNMTIAEAIKLAACMNQLSNDGKVTLKNGNPLWYSTYVDFALANGIISAAYPKYDALITRREFVNIFYNAWPTGTYTEINTVLDGKIPDVPMSSQYANKIYLFYRAGILTGSDEAGNFLPESSIKRSEVAAIMTRMFRETARREIELK